MLSTVAEMTGGESMKSKVSAAASIFLLGMMIGSLAAAQDFHLKGIEISPGATTKNCIAGVGGNYTTNGITFAGSAAGDAQGTWVVSLDTTGALDANCEPVRCPENNSPVVVTGGNWLLKILLGTVGGPITGGMLQYRPDGPVVGSCLGPVPGDLSVAVDLALGRFRRARNAQMDNIFLDHTTFPPRVAADLTLTP
jgi:hypothetical protein